MWNSALGMPLGIMTREGGIMSASPHASQEYLRLPGGLLRPRDGRYQLRLTEELWETAYLDERSEEHTSELQSLAYLVCRLLLEKKKKKRKHKQLFHSLTDAERDQ